MVELAEDSSSNYGTGAALVSPNAQRGVPFDVLNVVKSVLLGLAQICNRYVVLQIDKLASLV